MLELTSTKCMNSNAGGESMKKLRKLGKGKPSLKKIQLHEALMKFCKDTKKLHIGFHLLKYLWHTNHIMHLT